MKERTKAYVAGLMDAEGTFEITPLKRDDCTTFAAQISFSNTFRPIHKYLVNQFGGQFYKIGRLDESRKNERIEYRWRPTGAEHSKWFLSQIRPYLRIKDREADILVEYYSMSGIQSSENNRRRRELANLSSSLKNRSVETDIQKFSGEQNTNAYFAGLIDGDGCITISKNRCRSYFVYNGLINIVNTYPGVIKSAEALYGGRFRLRTEETENRRRSFEWATRNKSLIESALLKFLPYLIIKRDQAKLLLNFVREKRIEKVDVNPSRHDFREDYFKKMLALNRPEN